MDREKLFGQLERARDLAADIVNIVQEKEESSRTALVALCIAYTTLGKAMGCEFYELMDISMTVYKRTSVVEGDEE